MHRLLPLLTLLLFLPFPSAGGEVDSGGRADREVLEVLKGEDYYTRAAFGDVYPLHPGGEAVVVGRDQKVSILYGSWPYFERLVAFEDKWFLMTVAVGDLLPEYPGEEIVVGGWSEVVTLIWWDGGFHHKSLYNYRDWIYDIEIGDVDPRYPGEEILVVGETGEATLLHRTNGMNFSAEVVHRDPYLIDGAYIGDFDPTHPGEEIAIAGAAYNITEVYYDGGWKREVIWQEGAHIIEVDGGDLFPSHPGEELVAGGAKGRAVLLYKEEGVWRGDVIFSISGPYKTIYDVDVGEGDITHQGREVLISSWDGGAYMLYPPAEIGGRWEAVRVFKSNYLVIGGEMGELDPTREGNETLISDTGGGLYAVYSTPPGAVLYVGDRYYLSDGGNATIPIHVHFTPGYSSTLRVSVIFVEGGGEISVSPEHISTSGGAVVVINNSEGGLVEVSLVDTEGREVASKRFTLIREEGWVSVELVEEVVVVSGYTSQVLFNVKGGLNTTAELSPPLRGLEFSPNLFNTTPGEHTVRLVSTSTPEPGPYPMKLHLLAENITYFFTFKVTLPESGDFRVLLSPRTLVLPPGGHAVVDGAVLPIGEFSGEVILSVEGGGGISAVLSRERVSVGDLFSLNISASEDDWTSSPVIVRVLAEVGGKVREGEVTVVVKEVEGGVRLLLPDVVKVREGEVGVVEVEVHPEGDFQGDVEIKVSGRGLKVEREHWYVKNLSEPIVLKFNVSSQNPGEYNLIINLTYTSDGERRGENYSVRFVVEKGEGGRGLGILIAALLIIIVTAGIGLFFYIKRKTLKD